MVIDLLVLAIIILATVSEAKEGFINSLLDFLLALLSIFIGILAYQIAFRLSHSFQMGIISFLISALVLLFVGSLLLSKIKRGERKMSFSFNAIGGAISGFLLGIGAAFAVLTVLSLLFSKEVEESKLGNKILDFLPKVYYLADMVDLKFPMLKNAYQDEWKEWGIQFRERVNFSRLDGSTCIQCGGKVKFKGYFRRQGILVSPLFVCSKCGRKSDGCQTFEGFHQLYNKCPIEVVKKKVVLDCGVWPNGKGVIPKGSCPVCGKRS